MDKNRLKILVIDDEAEIISELTDTITAWGRHNSCETVVDSFTSIADSGVCNYMEFSLIILDIRIGDDNGIDFAKSLRKKGYGATIAFISNYEQYAISGYAVHAITYILKPLDHSKIYELLDFDLSGNLILALQPIRTSFTGQHFASVFLQTPPRDDALDFCCILPTAGWIRDFHPLECVPAGHTMIKGTVAEYKNCNSPIFKSLAVN